MPSDLQLQPQLEPLTTTVHPVYRTEPVLEALPQAGAILDPGGRIVACNAAWRALAEAQAHSGRPGLVLPEDDEGSDYAARLRAMLGPLAQQACDLARLVQDALEGDPHDQAVDYKASAFGAAGPDAQAIVCPLPDGRVLVQHVPRPPDPAARHATALVLALKLERERGRMRQLRRRLASIGRELHNPLTPLRLELHLLAQGALGPLTEPQMRAYAIIERSVDRLVQGEAAFMRVAEPQPVAAPLDLVALARAAVEAGQTGALKQGVRLTMHGVGTLPVRCDPDALLDLVERLVTRAVEGCASGGDVTVQANGRDDEAVLTVTDSGAGLSAEALRDVFGPWSGGEPSTRGADVQLYAMRRTLRRLGGRMWAESPGPGRGLTVGLALPAN